MESFRERFVQNAERYQVEPLQGILDKLSLSPMRQKDPHAGKGESDKENHLSMMDSQTQATTNKDNNYQHPTELDLHGQTLSLKMCKSLADTLQNDQVFTRLNLADTLMGDDGCVVLMNGLKANATVQRLDLRGNNIRSDGATAIAQLLKVNGSIQSLLLEWNCLGIWEAGINALADALSVNQSLQELDLRNNKMGPQAGSVLAHQLKHNTTLRRLDLRWNQVGLLGGRGFLEVLKWNKTLLHVELAGNEVPEDTQRAIEMALERNRESHRTYQESHQRSQFLSSTLQQISSEHEQSLQALRAQLLSKETMAEALGQKLHLASGEIEQGQMGYRVLENRWTEEKTRREGAEKKARDMEELLAQERREHSERIQSMMNDLMNERGSRVRSEENFRVQIAQFTERQLISEAATKEATLKLDILAREKSALLQESERQRKEIGTLQKSLEEQARQAQQWKREADAAHRRDMKDLQETMAEKMRAHELDRAKLDEMAEAIRQKATEWDTRMKNTEKQIRLEENAKRQELVAKLQALAQHRESLQQSLNSHLQTHRQTITDYEARIHRDRETMQDVHGKVALLTHERDQFKQDVDRMREKAVRWEEMEYQWKAKLDKLETDNLRWKTEAERLQKNLDRIREEEVGRAKELERAISGYVRSVERSEKRITSVEQS